MAKKLLTDKNKKIALAALLLLMVVVAAYQFLAAEPPKPRTRVGGNRNSNQSTSETTSSKPAPKKAPAPVKGEEAYEVLISDTTPLNLGVLKSAAGTAAVGPRGDIFQFFKEPPPPPVPPPPPPPITLQAVQPSNAMAGTPRPFTLTVTGQGYPEDAQILIDGRPRQTKRVGPTQLSTEITANEYSSPRNMNIEVKSQSDPVKTFSTSISLVISPSPEPPFKYVGRIGDQAVLELSSTKEFQRKKRGETVQGNWRIDNITDQALEITFVPNDIKKRVPMQEKNR